MKKLLWLFLVAVCWAHEVDLSWQESAPNVTFNVYRAGCKTCLQKKIATGVPTTDYIDPTVTAGKKYVYWITAVNQEGVESDESSPVKIVIPYP